MSRYNFQIKVGSYSGTGATQTISDVGFQPDLVIVKGGSNHAVFRTKEITGDATGYLANNVANFSGAITSFTSSGFILGTDATANASGTTYYYIAMRGLAGQNYFRTFSYEGTGGDNRDVTSQGLEFTPDFITIKHDGANFACSKWSLVTADLTTHLNGTAEAANEIQSLIEDGFQLGTGTRVNNVGSDYYGFAMKNIPNTVASGSFTGNGSSQTIEIGFEPDWVILRNRDTTNPAVIKTSVMSGVNSEVVTNFAFTTAGVTGIVPKGFVVGSTAAANGSGNVIYYIAGKAGDFNAPVTRSEA